MSCCLHFEGGREEGAGVEESYAAEISPAWHEGPGTLNSRDRSPEMARLIKERIVLLIT
jgi:hypothetical protein